MQRLTLIQFTLLLLALAGAVMAFRPADRKGYSLGDSATDFKLKNVDGKMISLADFKDAKGALVVFSCNHCPWVVKYEDRMNDLAKKYQKKGFPLIAINPNDAQRQPEDSFEKMIERHKEKKFAFPYVYDETQEVARRFGAEKTPHVYVLNREEGKFVVRYIGAIDDTANAKEAKVNSVAEAIEALLVGKEVPTKETKAIGCTIKWAEGK